MPKDKSRGIDRSWIDDLHPDEIRALEESARDTPGVDNLPLGIAYSDRGPNDYILSGPLGAGTARGRRFDNLQEARNWILEHFSDRLRGEVTWNRQESNPQWFALIRPPSPTS